MTGEIVSNGWFIIGLLLALVSFIVGCSTPLWLRNYPAKYFVSVIGICTFSTIMGLTMAVVTALCIMVEFR